MSRRARRIASDEAHSWARNLRLGNPQAKLILSMITLYVDGEGCCFVSIPALAEDCEMSANTIRRRLAWLESIGVISRTPQWLDTQGRRNSKGQGKRTSDVIRLMISPTCQGGPISPTSLGGLQPVSPSPALHQPSHCGQVLTLEPEPEQKEKGLIEVKCEEALRAWDEHGKRTNGRSYPRTRRGTWNFPSEWPPGHEAAVHPLKKGSAS